MDETIVPCDYETAGQIIDDDMYTIFASTPAGVRLTCVMDCCHSGTGLDLPYNFRGETVTAPQSKSHSRAQHRTGGSRDAASSADANVPGTTQADIILFSGCRDDQTSADTTMF